MRRVAILAPLALAALAFAVQAQAPVPGVVGRYQMQISTDAQRAWRLDTVMGDMLYCYTGTGAPTCRRVLFAN